LAYVIRSLQVETLLSLFFFNLSNFAYSL